MSSKDKEQALISVIVPVYNVAPYLKQCVESILEQTHDCFELLLIDDGSTDSSLSLCETFASEDNRIKVFSKSNGGLSDARNFGVSKATGRYITFVDSDDWVEPEYLEYLYNQIKESNADIATCTYYTCIDNHRFPWNNLQGEEIRIMQRADALESLLYSELIDVSATCKLYKVGLLTNNIFPIGMHFEDVGTTYKLIMRSNAISVGTRPLYNYVMREGSIVHQRSNKVFDRFYLASNAYAELTNQDSLEVKKAALRYKCFHGLSVLHSADLRNEEQKKLAQDIRKQILGNKKELFHDERLPKRDRIAIHVLKLGLSIYQLSWNLYLKVRGQ